MAPLAQPVLALGLVGRQPADARQRAARIGYRNGDDDPTGLNLTAAGTVMDRDPNTGDVTDLRVSGAIRFHFQDMDGEADEMSVNLRRHVIIARGTTKQAVLRWANGRTVKASQVNHNYQTKQTQSWNGRVQVPTSR